MDIFSLATVFFLSIAPVGGLGAAVPTGIALGLSPFSVIVSAVLASAFLAVLLPPLCGLATRHPKISSWIEKKRSAKASKFFQRYGVWGMSLFGRFVVGPYGTLITIELFGVQRKKTFFVFVIGSIVIAGLFSLITLGGISLVTTLF